MKCTSYSMAFCALPVLVFACGGQTEGSDVTDGGSDVTDGNSDSDSDVIDGGGLDASYPDCGVAQFTGTTLIPDMGNGSYETFVTTTAFDTGQTLTAAGDFVSVCVLMEHSWVRDLQIELTCPSGEVLVLQEYSATISELQMGTPVDEFKPPIPTPGIGASYCWTANALRPSMLEFADNEGLDSGNPDLPPGDYKPIGSVESLVGCSLNGDWTLQAVDSAKHDDGFIFEWSVNFDPSIISDCSSW